MERVSKNKIVLTTLILSIILFIVFIIAVVVGKYAISIDVFLDVVFNPNTTYQVERSVILNLRLPRTITALLVGVALSISGLIYQDIFQGYLKNKEMGIISSHLFVFKIKHLFYLQLMFLVYRHNCQKSIHSSQFR